LIKVILFSINLKLESILNLQMHFLHDDKVVFLTPHLVFDNEENYLIELFGRDCEFIKFADFTEDEEMARIDVEAYERNVDNISSYLEDMKVEKNRVILKRLIEKYGNVDGYLFSDNNDIGIFDDVWLAAGFKRIKAEYYNHSNRKSNVIRKRLSKNKALKNFYRFIRKQKEYKYHEDEIFVAEDNGKKYIFIGKMYRISYRLNLEFVNSKEEFEKLNSGQFYNKEQAQYLTTIHEHGKCQLPDKEEIDVRWIQDGYLPPNYSEQDYAFIPHNVKYYVWDSLGAQLFLNKGLPVEMIPFRKKLYMPEPLIPNTISSILVVASGSGDWTALKNRSDDDIMVKAFAEIARRFPNIEVVYRVHPSWVHPQNLGVNSINRVSKYFEYINLPNLKLSSNVPNAASDKAFKFSFPRSSLEEDLEKADIVFGEHSVSMIDAAFKKKPFASVNLTKRRNFFVGMTNLGFPHCSTIRDICDYIENVPTEDFAVNYKKAVKKYNNMTDEEKF
jgi:hypothetical protein